MSRLDRFLNSITMYRLAAYGLGVLLLIAAAFAGLGVLDFSPVGLIVSCVVLTAACRGADEALSRLYGVPRNLESSYITALILCLILPPPVTADAVWPLALAGVLAVASKYVLAWNGKHLFNPAAAGVTLVTLLKLGFATWWVGSSPMLPFTAILGFLIVRKIRRWPLVLSFFGTALVVLLWLSHADGYPEGRVISQAVTSWPLVFFGTVMLTEPLTSPPTRWGRVAYGALAGLLVASRWHFGPFYATPAMALVAANLASFAISPKRKAVLRLKEKRPVSKSVYDLVFEGPKLAFAPGQYAEWTLPHPATDGRGNRRYFTVASSPTEAEVHLGVKFYEPSSSFKARLKAMEPGDPIWLGTTGGDFTLPKDTAEKLAFIAGGVGITPFRSMAAYARDTGDTRDAVLLYSVADPTEVAFTDIWDDEAKTGIRPVYVLNAEPIPKDWKGAAGFITEELVRREIPDFADRLFYISGPNAFVDRYRRLLIGMGVKRRRIRTDYFPGY